MLTTSWTATLAVAVAAAVALQIGVPGSGLVAVTSGFVLVCCGTLLLARLSHSPAALRLVRQTLREIRAETRRGGADPEPLQWFLRAASLFRTGNIRPAEEAARQIRRPVLRRGTQLVLDGFQRSQLVLALQRQIAEERDRLVAPVEVLRAMAGYAPTLGMLGTLIGLLHMLFGVGSAGSADSMASAMGFAMMTTVYGLILSNLVLKPLAVKVEQRNRHYFMQSLVDVQAAMLLFERHHPEYIREVMLERVPRPAPSWLGAPLAGATG